MTTTATGAVRLMKPNGRVETRLHHAAIEKVAAAAGTGKLDLEDRYTNTRNALAHLMSHDRYRTRCEDGVQDLLANHRLLMEMSGTAEYFGSLEMQKYDSLFQALDKILPGNGGLINGLVMEIRKLEKEPKFIEFLGKEHMKRMESAAQDLAHARLQDLQRKGVAPQHVSEFLQVVDTIVELYQKEGWDSSTVISPQLYALAQMIEANFKAYDLTLNT